MRPLALLAALLLAPASVHAEDSLVLHPFGSVSAGMGFAQDNGTVTAASVATASLSGVGAMGPVVGGNVGLDLRYGDLFAGARVGYQRSWLRQSLDASLSTGESLRASGSLDQGILALARLGWCLSGLPIYLTGGWVWSWASTSVAVHDLGTFSDTVHQDGGAVGLGVQPSISENWFLEFEYLLVFYRRVDLPTMLGPVLGVQVRSVASTFTVSGGYRF